LSLHPSFAIAYNWGTLALVDSLKYSYNLKDYLSNPPILNEFSLGKLSFNLGLGININYSTKEEKQGDKNILHIYKIGLFAHYFSPFLLIMTC